MQGLEDYDAKWLDTIDWSQGLTDYSIYLNGTALLINCLQLATVANRNEIEERLLLPARAVEEA